MVYQVSAPYCLVVFSLCIQTAVPEPRIAQWLRNAPGVLRMWLAKGRLAVYSTLR